MSNDRKRIVGRDAGKREGSSRSWLRIRNDDARQRLSLAGGLMLQDVRAGWVGIPIFRVPDFAADQIGLLSPRSLNDELRGDSAALGLAVFVARFIRIDRPRVARV